MPVKNQEAFVTWNTPAEFTKASQAAYKALDAIQPIQRATGAIANRFQDIDGTTSVRDSVGRLDYEFFRPNEQIPKRFRDILFACNGAYQKIAIVRQMIDLMGDFCSSGMKLVHPNESVERFYNEWFKHVHGQERSERLANLLYRVGNVVVKRNTGTLNKDVVAEWKRAVAGEIDFKHRIPKLKDDIPLRYTFLNPMILEVLGEDIAAFTGRIHYALKLPMAFYRSLNLPLTSFDPAILTEELPRDIQGAFERNERYIVLDPDKLVTCYYKKDDWDVWAYPLLYSLLDDLILFQKMKLADLTALDGVISHVRIWKLGSLDHKIIPTDAAINKLASILLNHVAGGSIDFIWGPDIQLEETSTDVYKFLGGEKYESVMAHIHSGLGVPASMKGEKGSFSDNFLSLRTLIERLEYGRKVLIEFWENEMKIIQNVMGFRYPPRIVFDNMNLHDETAEKALWIQLADRGIVSEETLQEVFGQIPEIEQIRLKRENNKIKDKRRAPKVSPYHDAQPELSLEKIFAQRGMVTPSEVGVELEEKGDGEKTGIEMQGDIDIKKNKAKPPMAGPPGQGRPKNSKDKSGRKQRTTKPRQIASQDEFINLFMHANSLQNTIASIVNPFFLEKFSKQNLRQLTAAEEKQLDDFKFNLLFALSSNIEPTEENIIKALEEPGLVYNDIKAAYQKMIKEIKKQGKELTYDNCKNIRNYLYALFKGEYE